MVPRQRGDRASRSIDLQVADAAAKRRPLYRAKRRLAKIRAAFR
jgi:hypothetical protein